MWYRLNVQTLELNMLDRWRAMHRVQMYSSVFCYMVLVNVHAYTASMLVCASVFSFALSVYHRPHVCVLPRSSCRCKAPAGSPEGLWRVTVVTVVLPPPPLPSLHDSLFRNPGSRQRLFSVSSLSLASLSLGDADSSQPDKRGPRWETDSLTDLVDLIHRLSSDPNVVTGI